jgi:hypothetical protein
MPSALTEHQKRQVQIIGHFNNDTYACMHQNKNGLSEINTLLYKLTILTGNHNLLCYNRKFAISVFVIDIARILYRIIYKEFAGNVGFTSL